MMPSLKKLTKLLLVTQRLMVTAESCTGGLLGASLTTLSGSSSWFDRGFITYSNDAKVTMLGVSPELIQQYGAVSAEVAQSMAEGALHNSRADVSIAITGIAGPTGGTSQKPVGTVCFGFAQKNKETITIHKIFPEKSRYAIRRAATRFAIEQIYEILLDETRFLSL